MLIVTSETDTTASKAFDALLDIFASWGVEDYSHHREHYPDIAKLFNARLCVIVARAIAPYLSALTRQKLKTTGDIEAIEDLIAIQQRIKSFSLSPGDYFILFQRVKDGLTIVE